MAKFEKTSETIDLQKEQEKYEKALELANEPVAKRIAEMFGHEIEPMRYLAKGKHGVPVSVRIYENQFNKMETLRDSTNTPFENMSEIYRACIYLGALIFINKYQLQKHDPIVEKRLKYYDFAEKRMQRMFLVDDIIEEIQKVYTMVERKGMTLKEGTNLVKDLIACVDDRDIVYVREHAEKVFAGAQPIHVFEKATKGRPKSYE